MTIITRGFCPLIISKGLNLELGIKVDEITLNTASSLAKEQRVPMGRTQIRHERVAKIEPTTNAEFSFQSLTSFSAVAIRPPMRS